MKASAIGPAQRDADHLLEQLWRCRVAANERRRAELKRLRRPRLVDPPLPMFLRPQAE